MSTCGTSEEDPGLGSLADRPRALQALRSLGSWALHTLALQKRKLRTEGGQGLLRGAPV